MEAKKLMQAVHWQCDAWTKPVARQMEKPAVE